MSDSVVLLGIRHHGPGSARAVRRALQAYQPEVVLIEGPPEADALVPLAGSHDMRRRWRCWPTRRRRTVPRPDRAVLAVRRVLPGVAGDPVGGGPGVPVRFFDLPAAHHFAARRPRRAAARPGYGSIRSANAGRGRRVRRPRTLVGGRGRAPASSGRASTVGRAGRRAGAVRGDRVGDGGRPSGRHHPMNEDARREAHMRTVLRAAGRQHERVAVVCGAWHVPALTAQLPAASADAAVLRGLPKGQSQR